MSKSDATAAVLGCLAALAVVALVPIVIGYSVLASAFVLTKLWGWYMVPLFGLPALSLAHAIGVSAVFAILRGSGMSLAKEEEDSTKRVSKYAAALSFPWIVLLIGWLAL